MAPQKNYIVTQCYGNEGIFYECAFALLSLSRVYGQLALPDTEIWIYTDKPEWFSRFADCPLPLQFRTLDAKQITEWKGKDSFVHRLKIELLRDLVANKHGNILYMDTDVVLTRPIDDMLENIHQGALYMHVEEGKVSACGNPVLKKLNTFFSTSKEMQAFDQTIADTYMWNAGVLGFHTDKKDILEPVLALTDNIYPLYPKHVVEQFSFSYWFSKKSLIKAAAPNIIHYWNLKELREILAGFFTHFSEMPWSQLVTLSGLLAPHIYMQEKAGFYQGRSIADKLQKKKWHPSIPDWVRLGQQIVSNSTFHE